MTIGQQTGQNASRTSRPQRLRGALTLALGACLGTALTLLAQGSPAQAGKASLDRQTFDRAMSTILDRHVDPVDEQLILSAALKAAVSGLDRHSSYVTRPERQALKTRGTTGFSGMFVHFDRPDPTTGASVVVRAVYPDTPAAQAGIQPGDTILSIDGTDVAFLSSHGEVERALAGRPGSTKHLVTRKPGKAASQVDYTLTGAGRTTVAGELRQVDGRKLGIITIRAFRPGTGEQFKHQLAELKSRAGGALDGLLIDLRNNPGGEVDEAAIIADTFLTTGLIVRTRGRAGRVLREERAHKDGTDTTTPIVVVQNRFSASASELLTVALKDHKRARIIGETSFGKGTIQQVEGLPDGSLLTLTVARYYSPSDHRIDGHGVDPDVAIAQAEAPGPNDPWLQRGVQELVAANK